MTLDQIKISDEIFYENYSIKQLDFDIDPSKLVQFLIEKIIMKRLKHVSYLSHFFNFYQIGIMKHI